MKRLPWSITLCLLLLSATSSYAQSNVEIAGWVSWLDVRGENPVASDDFTVDIDFDSGAGFGLSTNFFWGNFISTELSAYAVDAAGAIVVDGESFVDLGDLKVTPLSAMLQFHFARSARLHPYFGLGASYVLIDDLKSSDLIDAEVGSVEIDDEVTYMVGAGLSLDLGDHFGLGIDAKYFPLEPASRGTNDLDADEVDLELNPLLVSAGLRWRF